MSSAIAIELAEAIDKLVERKVEEALNSKRITPRGLRLSASLSVFRGEEQWRGRSGHGWM